MGSSGVICEICGNKSLLPYKCRYCGGRFCPEHRLPENHNCLGIKRIRENPRWRDYASQVKRRKSPRTSSHRDRWDKEEEKMGKSFLGGGIRIPGSSSWYPSGKIGAAKKNLLIILVLSLVTALLIRFLL